MNLKSLATGVATAAGAVAIVGAAAAGVTSLATVTNATAPQANLLSWDVPMPQVPAPELAAPLTQTLNALATGGSFSGNKAAYIEGGVGRIEGITADRAFTNAQAKGLFPLTFNVVDIDLNGPVATANVTATAANGVSTTRPVTFIAGKSPTGWLVQKGSALSLLASAG